MIYFYFIFVSIQKLYTIYTIYIMYNIQYEHVMKVMVTANCTRKKSLNSIHTFNKGGGYIYIIFFCEFKLSRYQRLKTGEGVVMVHAS